MHCFIRSSKSKGRAHRSLIERFWKGLDCSAMPSKTNPEGNKPFHKESHGPGHPGGGNHPPPGGGAMVPSIGHIYMLQPPEGGRVAGMLCPPPRWICGVGFGGCEVTPSPQWPCNVNQIPGLFSSSHCKLMLSDLHCGLENNAE